jgi:CHAD domain-containing protein
MSWPVKTSPLLPVDTWLDDFARQIERLRVAIEPDAVHRMRVAAGRLSVWLELGARRSLRSDLRRLRRSAAAVRDLDVLGSRDAEAAWLETLRQERAAEAASLKAAASSPRVQALLDALAVVPEPDPVHVRSAIQHMKRRVQRAGDRLEEDGERNRALHRLRRRVRRLRYALEWMGADSTDLRELQGHLGTLNDLAVELGRLEARDGDPTLADRRSSVGREIEEHRASALEAWKSIRPRIGEL